MRPYTQNAYDIYSNLVGANSYNSTLPDGKVDEKGYNERLDKKFNEIRKHFRSMRGISLDIIEENMNKYNKKKKDGKKKKVKFIRMEISYEAGRTYTFCIVPKSIIIPVGFKNFLEEREERLKSLERLLANSE